MAKYVFDPKKAPPASGSRQVYIRPGTYHWKITKYSDAKSQNKKSMHAFTLQVLDKGDEQGKKITDYFVVPGPRENQFALQRLNALIVAVVQPKDDKPKALELSKLVGKTLTATIQDEVQEARKGADGKDYPKRTVSRLAEYIDPRKAGDDEDEDDEEEEEDEDEEESEDEEEEEDDSDDEDEEEDEEDDDEEDDEDEEEEDDEPPARSRKSSSKSSAKAPAKKAKAAAPAKAKGKAKATTSKRKSKKDEDDFPDDDDD